MRQHLLTVERPADAFADLVTAVRAAGGRVGWLELEPPAPLPPPLPPSLAAAADLGVLRAVAVGGGRSVAVKPMRGAPVLGDLLREHYRGCMLVLVRGAVPLPPGAPAPPRLEPAGDGWTVHPPDGAPRRLDTEALVAVLRRPHPWGRPPAPPAPPVELDPRRARLLKRKRAKASSKRKKARR